jgi:transcriptional regulator with GAF, ATPase, and Fis domain
MRGIWNMGLKLGIVSGPLEGQVFALAPESTSIGSSSANSICIIDRLVSARHCLIQREQKQCCITDLGSRFGTFVNKLPVQKILLEPGDCICVGNSLLVLLDERQEDVHPDRYHYNCGIGLIGQSVLMKEVHDFLRKVASSDTTVLIEGESGTGKELAAQAIHLNSPRRSRPFVAINCAALSEHLLESELFGHEKGSFTGALTQKKGRLELAEGGTVFLDEVGELASNLQAKLLRMIQTHEFERVGGTQLIRADIRLLSATNRDLEAAVKSGEFRADLYYRLAVISLKMPPLRDCREDIPALGAYFAAKCSQKVNRQVVGISAPARSRLLEYDWPGNVRELQNVIERAVVLGTEDSIRDEDLPEWLCVAGAAGEVPACRYREAITQMKRQVILKALEQAHGRCTQAAKSLGVHPNHLRRLVRTLLPGPDARA